MVLAEGKAAAAVLGNVLVWVEEGVITAAVILEELPFWEGVFGSSTSVSSAAT